MSIFSLVFYESFVCPLCLEEEEDELHFLLQCPVYHDLRLKYLYPFDSPTTEETFQNLLATDDHCLIQGVSLYIPEERKLYIRQ